MDSRRDSEGMTKSTVTRRTRNTDQYILDELVERAKEKNGYGTATLDMDWICNSKDLDASL